MLDNVWTEVSTEPDNSVTRRQPGLAVGVDLRRYTAFCGDALDFRMARPLSTAQAEDMDTDNMSPPAVESAETTAVDEVAESLAFVRGLLYCLAFVTPFWAAVIAALWLAF
jgi:hypothetical protein